MYSFVREALAITRFDVLCEKSTLSVCSLLGGSGSTLYVNQFVLVSVLDRAYTSNGFKNPRHLPKHLNQPLHNYVE